MTSLFLSKFYHVTQIILQMRSCDSKSSIPMKEIITTFWFWLKKHFLGGGLDSRI